MKSIRIITVVSLCALALVALSGCGKTTSPTSPTSTSGTSEPAPPAPPTNLDVVSETSTSIPMLTWSASPTSNVAGYEVYVFQPSPARDNAYQLLVAVDNTVTFYRLPGEYWNKVQYFKILAVDPSGNHSTFSSVLTANVGSPNAGTGGTSGGGSGNRGHE